MRHRNKSGLSIAFMAALLASCGEPDCPIGSVRVGEICKRTDAGLHDEGDQNEHNVAPVQAGNDAGEPGKETGSPPTTTVATGDGSTASNTTARDAGPSPSMDSSTATTASPSTAEVASPGAACTPGSFKCDDRTPSECLNSGQWMARPQCPFACEAGQCVGTCVPNSRQCDSAGRNIQVCGPKGAWDGPLELCSSVCRNGSCAGVCMPGMKECIPGTTTQQTCDQNGAWKPDPVTAGVCEAACTPGATGCAPNSNRSATCDATGKWIAGNPSKACGAVCVPPETDCDDVLHRRLSCTAQGTWDSGKVTAGDCGAVCTPGRFACGTLAEPNKPLKAFAVATPGTVFYASCDQTGQIVSMKVCNEPCSNFSCPGMGGFLETAYLCDASGAAPTCRTGVCPSAASLGVPGC